MSTRRTVTPKVVGAAFGSSLVAASTLFSHSVMADAVMDALSSGKVYGDIRMRYEAVDQDNNLKDADALTIRTRLGYNSGSVSGFSGTLEFEDSRPVLGVEDYNSTLNGNTEYSVVADPQTTELDQAYLQYKNDTVTAKLGRQVITYDNHRFVGHVGWRQDRQTFDGATVDFMPIEGLTFHYAYISQRNRIFAEAGDLPSKDNLFNLAYKTPVGTLTGYAYLLEQDDNTELTIDTYGIRFAGDVMAGDLKILYVGEFATQEKDDAGGADFDADYMTLEAGIGISGITAKLGIEVLGSDDSMYGFSTPLATLHKFNGWADQFLATPNVGLVDTYVTASWNIPGAGNLTAVYHEFEADDSTPAVDDLGDEFDIVYAHAFGKHYNAGIKYAMYSAGDTAAGKVDTDKLWLWVGATF